MSAVLRANTDAELDAFEQVGHQLAGFDDRLHPEWIDGYLTALFAGPRAIPPEEWMPKAFGDAFDRAFGDPESAVQALAALRGRWKVIAAQLDPERLVDEPEVLFLSPLMWSPDPEELARLEADAQTQAGSGDDAESRWPGEGDEWAEGFLRAVADFADDWTLDRADSDQAGLLSELLSQVQALTFGTGSQAMAEHLAAAYPQSTPTRDELIDEACASIQEMRAFWIDFAPRPPPRTVEKTPGRNDFCPCGSGRKYKKCHGATPD